MVQRANTPDMRKNVFILSAPSGAGKNTVFEALRERLPHIRRVVTATTRRPRKTEQHGVDYYFYSPEEFAQKSQNGDFIEEAEYADHRYGSPRSEVEQYPTTVPVFLIIDVQGKNKVVRRYPCATSIFLMPPSIDELKRRICVRGDNTPEEIERRVAIARQEMECAAEYTHRVVNDSVERCVDEIERIVCGVIL